MYIVTGGGTGIGRAIALALQGQGHQVLITGRRSAPLADVVQASGGAITAVPCDSSTPEGARAVAARVAGRVEGLAHCAGGNPAIGRPDPDSLEAEAALLGETIAGNLTSAALTVTALAGGMAAGSSVVLFGSIAAERGVGYYGPAKAAVASYAVGLAADLGPRDIRVNCISPGYIAGTEFFSGRLSPERAEALRAQAAIGRTGQPADAVALTLFLLSSKARHITGQNFHLNGGAFTTR
ncbi:MAG TPA: SDR family oxidoreductase [Streptosporangiaceae bacterium]|nr:SDR family oxidoreductase [Streptosporangiaceae bacterium]